MPADFTIKAGDENPVFQDTLTLRDGTVPPLAGATIQFVMRSLTSVAPLTLTGTASIADQLTGLVQFAPTAADTAVPGGYMANWIVTFPNGSIMTWPTDGYLWVTIEENLTTPGGQQLVSLPDVKDYLASYGIKPQDHVHDAKLTRLINSATPIIENAAGPIIVRQYEEWHDGGQYAIRLKRRPSTAVGTSPVLSILGCDEYRGPIKYTLQVVADPAAAGIYSVMLDVATATLYRRTTGGGVVPFGAGAWGGGMPQAVHVVYQAGQAQVPENVRMATLEAIRHNYETTQPVGSGFQTVADSDAHGHMLPFFLPPVALEMLAPLRRHPAIA